MYTLPNEKYGALAVCIVSLLFAIAGFSVWGTEKSHPKRNSENKVLPISKKGTDWLIVGAGSASRAYF